MKAYLIDMHVLLPRSKVKFKGYSSQKMAISGAFVFHKHISLLLLTRFIFLCPCLTTSYFTIFISIFCNIFCKAITIPCCYFYVPLSIDWGHIVFYLSKTKPENLTFTLFFFTLLKVQSSYLVFSPFPHNDIF